MSKSTVYNGEHSIIFKNIDGTGGLNTWDDWFLIPSTRPTMVIPGPQTKYVEIPGMSGSYDLSNYLSEEMAYQDRSGTFEFVIDNDHADWVTIYENIINYIHGQQLRMILTDDPNYYYVGRFAFNEFKSDKSNSKVVINYRVSPFKISIYPTFTENIIWDTFNFERDYDWSVFWHITIQNQTRTFDIDCHGMKTDIVCRLVSGGPVTAIFNGVSTTLNEVGTSVSLGFMNRGERKKLKLSGSGVVDIGRNTNSL